MKEAMSNLPLVLDRVSLIAGEVTILNRLSVTINSGAPTFIVGPNGSGKSTLLRLCMGLTTQTDGHITWDGQTKMRPVRRAFVFQRPVMLRRSVAANVIYSLEKANYPRRKIHARIPELLERVGLLGLETRPARRLSGGEQQRLAIARALARDPELLFLDEPTASLDPAATRSIEDIVRMAAQSGIKIVMASHDLGQVRRLAGDVIFLVRGSICEQATAEQFLNRPSTPEAAAFVRGDLVI